MKNWKFYRIDWKESKRDYKLELHNNRVGRFLQCSIVLVEAKKFTLIVRGVEGVSPAQRIKHVV